MRILFILLLAILIPLGTVAGYVYNFLYLEHTQHDASVVVNKGDGILEISLYLSEKGIISNQYLFKVIAQLYTLQGKYIQAGEYFFPHEIAMREVLNMLLNGVIVERKITIVEGNTIYDVVRKVNSLEKLGGEAVLAEEFVEGSFLPETYRYSYQSTKRLLLERIGRSMDKALEKAWQARDRSIPLNSKEEALILASIVEKEAVLVKEMPIIASVYLNRLEDGMRLQADPTVIYGLSGSTGKLNRALTRKDLKKPGKYNTYINQGLPPTAICNPSMNAINAVLHPEKTEYLFFVSNANGGHWFSKSYKEHTKNVAKYKRTKKRFAKRRKKKRITR